MTNHHKISIIGCANIGKSTLFNCLSGRKIAITHDTPGVTIDARKQLVDISDQQFELVDTPGFDELRSPTPDKLRQINRVIRESIESSSCIIHMIDAQRGYDALDKKWARIYLRLNIPAVILVNKTDTIDQTSLNKQDFQFSNCALLFASAKHNHGLGQLKDWIVSQRSDHNDPSTDTLDNAIDICFIGKPNAGKSTMSNLLIGTEAAIVSDKPGTTTDTIRHHFTYHNKDYCVYDTAGIRKKSKVLDEVERYSVNQSIETIRLQDVTAILMIDATQGVADQDYRVIELLEKYRKRYLICINKWDLLDGEQKNVYKRHIDKIANNRAYVPIIMVSAMDKRSRQKVIRAIDKIASVPSLPPMSYLTKLVDGIVATHRPALVQNKEVKIRVCYPTPHEPMSVTIQGKRVSQLQASYRKYLQNALQKRLGIQGIKLALNIKEDDNPYRS